MSLTQTGWVPLGAALLGAVAGAGISWRALAWNAEKEWKRKKAQARLALQVEMYLNAQILSAAAKGTDGQARRLAPVLTERKFGVAFQAYFTEAMEGVAWGVVDLVIDAYGYAQVFFEGGLMHGVSGGVVREHAAKNMESFCKAIRAMSKYGKLEDSFYEEVEKLEKSLLRHGPQKGLPADSQP